MLPNSHTPTHTLCKARTSISITITHIYSYTQRLTRLYIYKTHLHTYMRMSLLVYFTTLFVVLNSRYECRTAIAERICGICSLSTWSICWFAALAIWHVCGWRHCLPVPEKSWGEMQLRLFKVCVFDTRRRRLRCFCVNIRHFASHTVVNADIGVAASLSKGNAPTHTHTHTHTASS